MKFILTIFILTAVVSTQAQINPVTIINGFLYVFKFFDWLVKTTVLTTCYLTDSSQASVKAALWASLVNSDNPNITRCAVGCTVSAIYTTESFFRNFTGIDPFGFVAKMIGNEIYGDIQACFAANTDWKCAYLLGYTTCIVPKITPIIESELGQIAKRVGILCGAILKRSIDDLKNSLGTLIPGSKPLFQSFEDFLIKLHILSSFSEPQRALGDISNMSVPLFMPVQNAISGIAGFLFPNGTVLTPLNATTVQVATTTTAPATTTTTTAQATTTSPAQGTTTTSRPNTTPTGTTTPATQSNVNPISNFLQLPGKIATGVEDWFRNLG